MVCFHFDGPKCVFHFFTLLNIYDTALVQCATITINLDDYVPGEGNMETVPSHKGKLVVHVMIVEQGHSIYSMKFYTLRK